jgi:hypothetical protein
VGGGTDIFLDRSEQENEQGLREANWFGGLTITLEDNGDTLLTGPVADQAALHGLLRKVRDLGMPLLLVIQSENGEQVYLDSEGETP